jgi:hypothetical protein
MGYLNGKGVVMAKKKRELLKFREGDCGLKIRKDGQLEVVGIDEAGGIIDEKGMVNPVLLFAAAWSRRDQKVFQVLIDNFKESVREGYFGPDAKRDYEKADKVKKEHEESLKEQNLPPFLSPPVGPYPEKVEEPVLDPDSKPTVTDSASGAVTFEQPRPYDVDGMLKGRDS